MKNVTMSVENDILTIRINLKERFGPSKSGKTVVIASTEGNPEISPGAGIWAGVNVYTK